MTPDRFIELTSQHRCLDRMINNVRLVDGPRGHPTLGYLFDGYLDCAVVFDGHRYFDVQDINIGEGNFNGVCNEPWYTFNSYESLEALVEEMGRVHDQV